jgi:hypothetical protein
LLVSVKIGRDRTSSDPNRQCLAEPPDGVVPTVSHMPQLQAGQVGSLVFEEASYEIRVYVCSRCVLHGVRRALSAPSVRRST